MTDEDITKIIAKLIVSLATKDDIHGVKQDIQGVKVDLQNVKTDVHDLKIDVCDLKTDVHDLKIDVCDLKTDVHDLKIDVQKLERKLEKKIDYLNEKADTILVHSEAVDEGVDKHEKRLRNIERIPIIASELKKPKF